MWVLPSRVTRATVQGLGYDVITFEALRLPRGTGGRIHPCALISEHGFDSVKVYKLKVPFGPFLPSTREGSMSSSIGSCMRSSGSILRATPFTETETKKTPVLGRLPIFSVQSLNFCICGLWHYLGVQNEI